MKIYMKFFRLHLQSVMQYKVSFLFTTVGQFLTSFNVFLGIYFMFQRFHNVKGFTYSEVLLCFSIVLMEFSIAEAFARGFDSFSTIISNGEFDRIMLRPRNEILLVLGSRIEFSRIGRFLQAVIMFIYGISVSNVSWDIKKVLTVVFMLFGGTIVFTGIFLIYAGLCFFTTDGLEFLNILTDGAREFGKYPISVYGKRIMQVCTCLIPFMLIQYYPLLYLLERNEKWFYMFLPLVASLFILPCYGLWRIGLRHYQSTGS